MRQEFQDAFAGPRDNVRRDELAQAVDLGLARRVDCLDHRGKALGFDQADRIVRLCRHSLFPFDCLSWSALFSAREEYYFLLKKRLMLRFGADDFGRLRRRRIDDRRHTGAARAFNESPSRFDGGFKGRRCAGQSAQMP